MFRCQFSGQVSDGPKYKWVEEVNDQTGHKVRVWKLIAGAEKPVTVVIATRSQVYQHLRNRDGSPVPPGAPHWETDRDKSFESKGFEIVQEIRVRPQHVAKVKELLEKGLPLRYTDDSRRK